MPDPDTASRRTRAAVEKAAREMCICEGECFETRRGWMNGPCEARSADAARVIRAYLRAQGRDLEADQVERCRDE